MVIDKVVVHRTESTLLVIAIGLGVFLLFSALLSWVRQYLVLHTGNRVDAVLGSAVFDHLFKLPRILRAPTHRRDRSPIAWGGNHPRIHCQRGRDVDARSAVPADLRRCYVLLQRTLTLVALSLIRASWS